MKYIISFIILSFFSVFTSAQEVSPDWKNINWQSGQILGISSRSGLTPVLVQMGTRSKIDHVGVVRVEKDGPWLYEYTNATGIQKARIADVWARSADKKGEVHFVLGSFHSALTLTELTKVFNRLDAWVARTTPFPPASCVDTVAESLRGVRNLKIDEIQKSLFIINALDGRISKVIDMGYPGVVDFPVIASIFNNLDIVAGDLPSNLVSSTETEFLSDWGDQGDLSKFARLINVTGRNRSSTNDLSAITQAFVANLYRDQVFAQLQVCRELF